MIQEDQIQEILTNQNNHIIITTNRGKIAVRNNQYIFIQKSLEHLFNIQNLYNNNLLSIIAYVKRGQEEKIDEKQSYLLTIRTKELQKEFSQFTYFEIPFESLNHFRYVNYALQINNEYFINRFCRKCGMLTCYNSNPSHQILHCNRCNEDLIHDMNVSVMCLMTYKDNALLCQRFQCLYSLAGGFSECSESLIDASIREICEEINCKRSDIKSVKPYTLSGFLASYYSSLMVCYHIEFNNMIECKQTKEIQHSFWVNKEEYLIARQRTDDIFYRNYQQVQLTGTSILPKFDIKTIYQNYLVPQEYTLARKLLDNFFGIQNNIYHCGEKVIINHNIKENESSDDQLLSFELVSNYEQNESENILEFL